MEKLESYVPESFFYRNKQQPSPAFWEDVAVLDVTSARVIASRTANILPGGSLFCSPDAVKSIRSLPFGEGQNRVLASVENRTVLVFADFSASTGIILAASVPDSFARTVGTLRRMGRTDFALPPAKTREPRLSEAREDALQALLYYTDSLFDPDDRVLRMTGVMRIAMFAGCRIDFAGFSPENLTVNPRDWDVFRLFLLCLFLQLRRRNGRVSIREREEESKWKVSVGQIEPAAHSSAQKPSVTEAMPEVFQAYRVTETADGIFAEVVLEGALADRNRVKSQAAETAFRLLLTFLADTAPEEPEELPPLPF